MTMYRKTYAEIDLAAMTHNWNLIAQGRQQFTCPMVKANAYGHGDVQVAKHLESIGAERVGVCLIEEGLLLREFGVKCEILVFRGFDIEGARAMVQSRLTPVVSTWDQIGALEEVAKRPIELHLKFDTGMNRLGFSAQDASKLLERLHRHPLLRVTGILTHLLRGEDAEDSMGRSAQQLNDIEHIAEIFKGHRFQLHALNSAAILHRIQMLKAGLLQQHPLLRKEWGVRPGLALYGIAPFKECHERLRAVMTLKSQVATFRTLLVGETISYNGTWTARRTSVIAVVPIGYADGYGRLLSNKAHVLFREKRVPVVGQVCMDYLMVDVTDVVHGDGKDSDDNEIVLFGPRQELRPFVSATELAEISGTIPWEILTSIGERVPRVYRGANLGINRGINHSVNRGADGEGELK